MSNTFWSEAVKATISLFVLLLSTGTPFVWRWVNQHFSLKQVQIAEDLARIAVNAVEKIASTQGKGVSIDKYSLARRFLDDLANAHHITLDDSQIQPLIESAVNGLDRFEAMPIQSLQGSLVEHTLSSEPALSIEEMVEQKIGEALKKVVWHPEVPVKVGLVTP